MFDVKEQFKGVEHGLPIGMGYDLMDRKINATLRYVIGLNTIANVAGITRHNNLLQVSVSVWLFRLNE